MKYPLLQLCVLLTLLAFYPGVYAATITVNSSSDESGSQGGDGGCSNSTGVCTLRAAIGLANQLSSNDTITFNLPAGTTIVLSSERGQLSISNNGSLLILGPGADLLTINGGPGSNRVLYTNQANVTLVGVTITGGKGAPQRHAELGRRDRWRDLCSGRYRRERKAKPPNRTNKD
jgi:CSLREA domain-containing protein